MNVYKLYVNVQMQDRKKNNLLSHHDFCAQIALSWINSDTPHISVTLQKRSNEDILVVSSITTDSSMVLKKSRATVVNDKSVKPTSNLSQSRLDQSLDHFLMKPSKSARCAVHRWLGIETEKDTYYCSACNVNVCILCNKPFHFVPSLLDMKNTLRITY